MAEKPGKDGGNGDAGGKGKGVGKGGEDSGGSTGDTGSQDNGTQVSDAGSSSEQETVVAQEVPVADRELAESYPDDTFPESYFLDKPLKKMQLQRYFIIDESEYVVSSVRAGDSVGVVLGFKNIQQKEQVYTLITQVVDQYGFTQDVGWSVDVVEGGGYVDWFKMWRPDSPGVCTIKVMVWDGVGGNPVPLSEVNAMTIVVQNASP